MTPPPSPNIIDHNLTSVIEAKAASARLNCFSNDAQDGVGQVRVAGPEALGRLLPVAFKDTGQSRVVARFLLSLYNGNRFPFDLTDFRCLDHGLFVDCMTVLHMDYFPVQEVHRYFAHGSEIWERMAKYWGVRDYQGESWR